MSDSVQMPALGESVTEGTVTRWLKQIGDRVQVDEPLLEVSTDKVDTEIPSPVAGVLEQILVNEDETVDIGTPLAMIGDGTGAGSEGSRGGGEAQSLASSRADSGPEPEAEPKAEPEPNQEQEPEPEPEPQPQAQARSAPDSATDSASGGDGSSDEGGTEVPMPALGESVTEGTVTRWLKQVGDGVEVDEPLLEVSTDKVDTEIPSPVAGQLTKILVNEDETVDVGTPLAVVGGASGSGGGHSSAQPVEAQREEARPEEQEQEQEQEAAKQEVPAPQPPAQASAPAQESQPAAQAPAAQPAAQAPAAQASSPEPASAAAAPPAPSAAPAAPGATAAPARAQAPAQARPSPESQPTPQSPQEAGTTGPADGAGYVTPLVRRMAAEQGVDLTTITGTGVGGRIRKQDIIDAGKAKAEAEAAVRQSQAGSPPAPASAGQESGQSSAQAPKHIPVSALRGTTEKMSRLRRVIAQRMVESLHTSAQLTSVVEADVTKIARLRDRAKADFAAREGVKLSFLPFFALAAVEALKQHPKLNASIEGDSIVYHAEENLGVAVDTERGLLAPVIHAAGDLNIAGLARRITDLADRTRHNKITPDELSGGTFTLTNTGSRGALFDTPILFQPQVAILGTGVVVKRPVVVTDEDGAESIAIRSIVYLALSYDHRLVDGADGARFLTTIKERLEEGAFEADLGL